MNGIRQLETEHEHFIRLKTTLTNSPILAFPDFQLHVDASENGLSAVLYNIKDGQKKVRAYASRTLSKAERNYLACKLEFLALKWSVTEKLMGPKFIVLTQIIISLHIF